jgi:hypothetical protein
VPCLQSTRRGDRKSDIAPRIIHKWLTLSGRQGILGVREMPMPDLDIVERRLTKAWRAPYRLIKGGHPAKLVADSLVKAAAATLRESGGMPGFEDLSAQFAPLSPLAGRTRTLEDASRALEQRFGQREATKLLVRAFNRSQAKIEAGRALPGPSQCAQEYVRLIFSHHFFDKLSNRLIGEGKRFATVDEARTFEATVRGYLEPQLIRLTRSLIADPTASNLRAPKALSSRRTTAEILDASVSEGWQNV